jgi:cytochrome c-type biogenesis protein
VILTYVATRGQVLYGTALLFVYAIGHCMLMLAAGTFTGFVESFVRAKGFVNFSAWTKRIGGSAVAVAGGYLLWRAF